MSPFRFKCVPGHRADGTPCVRVHFKDEEIALCDDQAAADRYVRTYGYLAEWRRQCLKHGPVSYVANISTVLEAS